MPLELFYSPHCRACAQWAARWPDADIRRLDVCEHLERAAALGVERVPALVADGVLVAQGAGVETYLRRIHDAGRAS